MVSINPFTKSVYGKTNKKTKKKEMIRTIGSYGQTEMLGLVIIVILIVIAALFYVRFVVLGGKGEQQKVNVIKSIQAYNLMNSIMNIKVCDNAVSIREGLVLCRNNEVICNKNACDYLKNEIENIAKMVIYRPYNLNISSSGWNYELGEGCKYGVSSYPYYYNLKGDTYKAYFKIC